MVALWNRADHYIFILCFFPPSSSSFFSPRLISASQTGCLPYFHRWCGLSANLRCRSEMCCTRLAENAGRKKSPKSRHLRTIVQHCRAISLQLRHLSTIGKKAAISSPDVPHNMAKFGVTSGLDRSGSLGHPCKFQRVSRLGSVTARQSSSERQPNFAELNRWRHLCSYSSFPSTFIYIALTGKLSVFICSTCPNSHANSEDAFS